MMSEIFSQCVCCVTIPAERRQVMVSDDDIFRDLKLVIREIVPWNGPAEKGDFLLCRLTSGKDTTEISLCLGTRQDMELDPVLMGKQKGDRFSMPVRGRYAEIIILSVKRMFTRFGEERDIHTLGLDGVKTREDYRQYYINAHRDQLQKKMVRDIFPQLECQFVEAARQKGFSPNTSARETYALRTLSAQRALLRSFGGGSDEEYQKSLENRMKQGSLRANEDAVCQQARFQWDEGTVAAGILDEQGTPILLEEYKQEVQRLAHGYRMSEAQYEMLIPFEDFQIAKGAKRLREMLFVHLAAMVDVVAEDKNKKEGEDSR